MVLEDRLLRSLDAFRFAGCGRPESDYSRSHDHESRRVLIHKPSRVGGIFMKKPCPTYAECDNGYFTRYRYISIWTCRCVPRWYRWLYFKVLHRKLRHYF